MDGYIPVATAHGQVLIRQLSVPAVAELDSIIFDVDGVLIDVSESIQIVHDRTAEIYFRSLGWSNTAGLVDPSDVDAFKLAGGFNSDWHLSYAWLLVYLFKSTRLNSVDGAVLKGALPTLTDVASESARRGGGLQTVVDAVREMCGPHEWAAVESRWDCEALRRVFVEVYSGDLCPEVYGFEPRIVRGPGLIRRDRPVLDRRLLPDGMHLGVATGRTAGETITGFRLMGWSDVFPPERIVSEDDGFRKPDPTVLTLASERTGGRNAVYVGDTTDDLLTVLRYNERYGRMLACMVLTGSAHGGSAGMKLFAERQADIVADNVNAALSAVDQCTGGKLCLAEKRT